MLLLTRILKNAELAFLECSTQKLLGNGAYMKGIMLCLWVHWFCLRSCHSHKSFGIIIHNEVICGKWVFDFWWREFSMESASSGKQTPSVAVLKHFQVIRISCQLCIFLWVVCTFVSAHILAQEPELWLLLQSLSFVRWVYESIVEGLRLMTCVLAGSPRTPWSETAGLLANHVNPQHNLRLLVATRFPRPTWPRRQQWSRCWCAS